MADVIVAGHILVDPSKRAEHLAGCVDVVRQARAAPGCLDFAIAGDPTSVAEYDVDARRLLSRAAEESTPRAANGTCGDLGGPANARRRCPASWRAIVDDDFVTRPRNAAKRFAVDFPVRVFCENCAHLRWRLSRLVELRTIN
jgi:hypothetical protein